MRSVPSDLLDPRFYALAGIVFLFHAVGFAGEASGLRVALWLVAGLGWLLTAAVLRRGRPAPASQ